MIDESSESKIEERYGIGEWYGRLFAALSDQERSHYLSAARDKDPKPPCLPRCSDETTIDCSKSGGVCSLRVYQKDQATGITEPVPGNRGRLVTTCPHRFEQERLIYEWIGETLLGDPSPLVLTEIGFLDRIDTEETGRTGRSDVGRIDNVLVSTRNKGRLEWCAMEKQAVYFQGSAMSRDWKAIAEHAGPGIPFPAARRQPDFRSSGPKRLMPQLQIKVPTLRRWGTKVAVVVDEAFFDSLAPMDEVHSVSNCDIAWFVVGYDVKEGEARLHKSFVRLTTLERAVEGLTAGSAVSLNEFEARIRRKLPKSER